MSRANGVLDRMRELIPRMPEVQRALAERILADPAESARMTIVELSASCGVSTGSITRLCRALGLSGYTALRIALASDSGGLRRATWDDDIGADIAESDDLSRVAAVISASVAKAIVDTVEGMDLAAVERAAASIATARRIEIYGVGGSGTMAAEFQQRLYRIGLPAWSWSDPHVALTGAAVLGHGDVVVAISHTGRTVDVRDLIAEAASHNALTVLITNVPGSAAAERADLVLTTSVRHHGFRTEAILARHAQMSVLDLLYIAVAQRTFEQTTAAMAVTSEAVQIYKSGPA